MSEVDDALVTTRAAVDEMIGAAAQSPATWTVPRAPGKWSPSQVVEHVARALEASADDIAGRPSNLPKLPGPLRFVARNLLFNRVVRGKPFPRAKTNRAMDPASGPATPVDGAGRLESAWAALASACAAAPGGEMTSQTFGRVRLADYLRFQESHTRHHCSQLPRS